jgi:hypothetical protein
MLGEPDQWSRGASQSRDALLFCTDIFSFADVRPRSDLTCPALVYSWIPGGDMLEFWGLGAVVALWRYFFDIDWDLRVKRRKRRKKLDRP